MEAVVHKPTDEEQKEAKIAHDKLESASKFLSEEKGKHRVELAVDDNIRVTIPESVLGFLTELLDNLGMGKAVSILPVESELSTQQAADILNVSRPHLVKMLEEGEIPYHTVGKHRRIYTRDLMEYKSKRDEERERLLDELASEAEDMDLGY